ncbi:MAG: hypothetical protein P0Y53_22100 [Candidatus Pseudobacter hemicellulosilyticus]|uniref:Entericidin n=1 Tax=Candidatus Pseudobacter hemicellulosilyticus TaxID=3121375 RepID=A0AAJ5WQR4_9BACT|nr:MAG: hypothetical protein P0Y53_22100 [Pseudobacter sp.]
MKKLLLVLAIGAFAACNDAGTGEAETKDTVSPAAPATPDSTTLAPDTTKLSDSTTVAPVDTTKK